MTRSDDLGQAFTEGLVTGLEGNPGRMARWRQHRRRQRAWRTTAACTTLVSGWALVMLWVAGLSSSPYDLAWSAAWLGTVVAGTLATCAALYLEDRNRLLADDLEAGRL